MISMTSERSPTEDRARKRKPREVRRFEIVFAARELFCERGFDRVSMDDVAAKVGITKAAVYLYFESKAELFFEVITQAVDRLISDLEEAFADPPHKPLVAKLDAANEALKGYAPVFRVSQEMAEGGLPDSDFPPQAITQFMRKVHGRRERIRALLSGVFAHAQEEGEVRRDISADDISQIFATYAVTRAISEVNYESAKEILLHGILTTEDKQ